MTYTKQTWTDGTGGGTPLSAARLGHMEDGIALVDTKAAVLVPTATKTAAYTLAAGDFVPVDATSANVPLTLPAAPADGTRIGAKLVATASSHTATLTCGGSDKINATTGGTTYTLSVVNQGVQFQYQAPAGVWIVMANDLPLSQLDARFVPTGTNALANQANVNAALVYPLVVPTPDGNLSVTHMDVVFVPGGWGYQKKRYWAAITPYPSATREKPEILCSDNGVDWAVPPGCPSPVVTSADITAAGMLYGSDCDLELLPDGVTMAMYYRPYRDDASPGETVYRKTSTDGINWSAQVECIRRNGSSVAVISPSVFTESDGSFVMFTINRTGASPYSIEKRTSAAGDGVTWSAPAAGTIPPGFSADLWHLDVIRVGTTYYALVDSSSPAYRLYLWTSTDGGATWAGSTLPAVPLMDTNYDDGGHYRSTLVAVPGDPTAFDVWVCCRRPGPDNTTPWRVVLRKNQRLAPLHTVNDNEMPRVVQVGGGRYLLTDSPSVTTATMSAGNVRWSKMHLPRCTIDEIGWFLSTAVASSVCRVGVWADSGTGRPTGSPIIDTGTWDTSVTAGPIYKALSPSVLLLPGVYHFGLMVDTAASAVGYRCIGVSNLPVGLSSRPSVAGLTGGINGFILSGVPSGALPTNTSTPAVGSLSDSAAAPIFWVHTVVNSPVD